MKSKIFIFMAGALVGFIVAYLAIDRGNKNWKPVLEGTDFQYLNNSIDFLINDLDEAEDEFKAGNKNQVNDALTHTRRDMLKLKMYYIPMTEIRQLIYDAERLYFLNKIDETVEKLKKSKDLLKEIIKLKSPSIRKSADELYMLIEELKLKITTDKNEAENLLKETGRKANLMLLKGGLDLTDIEFK